VPHSVASIHRTHSSFPSGYVDALAWHAVVLPGVSDLARRALVDMYEREDGLENDGAGVEGGTDGAGVGGGSNNSGRGRLFLDPRNNMSIS